MNTASASAQRYLVPFKAIVPFLLLTFGLAWGLIALFILFPEFITQLFGAISNRNPLFFFAVWSPAIAAFIVIIYSSGFNALGHYLKRLTRWRCTLPWYSFLFIGIPLIFSAGAAWKNAASVASFPFESWQALIFALLLTMFQGPIEEFGWHGLALPLLQRKFTPIVASLILGLIWGLWHLPAFLASGTPQSSWSFTPFLAGSIALSVLMTGLFNASRGSILLPILFHFQCNNPLWPNAQPYDTVLLIVAAIVMTGLTRKTMFHRCNAVTEVIPQMRRAQLS